MTKREVQRYYQAVCDLANDSEFSLEYPELVPTVEAPSTELFGICPDPDGKLTYLLIHCNRNLTDISANREIANEISDWY